ncbi:MAG TPA: alpha/beta hydrolase [Solirubrobacterales bacterium]
MSELPSVEGVSHRSVRARGLDFHVAEAGQGDDVVLCLHGWPQHWYEWRNLMPALADRHRVLALDLRGFGWSDAPRDGYEKENLADDVLAVLDEMGIERVKLVGHDWGGWLGFLLCMREPQRFERYLALNILTPWLSSPRAILPYAWRFAYQVLIMTPVVGYQLHRRGGFVPRVLRSGSTLREVWDEATLRAFADNLAEPDRARAAVQLYRVFQLRELWPIVRGRYADSRLTVPTRMLFGVGDVVLRPELLEGYERHADEMEVELVEDSGHFIADERPELVAERARDFFAAASPVRG